MAMGLLEETKISLEAILAFPFLDLPLHAGGVRRELKSLAIAKVHLVVGLTFQELNALGF